MRIFSKIEKREETKEDEKKIKFNEKIPFKKSLESPLGCPEPFHLQEYKLNWDLDYPEYEPVYYVAPEILKNDRTKNPKGWADPEDINNVNKENLSSYMGEIKLDDQGKPLNPMGRTGKNGRWKLGNWGPNKTADLLITKIDKGKLKFAGIKRPSGEWAVPGGFLNKGEDPRKAAEREGEEETKGKFDLDNAKIVFKGYVDDWRSTDNAWIETVAFHKHLEIDEEEKKIKLKGSDDAKKAKWKTLDEKFINKLYASHGYIIKKALAEFYNNNPNIPEKTKKQIEKIFSKESEK